MDRKVLSGLAKEMGFPEDMAEKKAAEYKNKSDEEILRELMKVKSLLKRDRKKYEKQVKLIKGLGAGMNDKEKARLDKLIELLEL